MTALAPLLACLLLQAEPEAPPPYELLRPETAWCGPRVLYFFACYLGRDCTLDEVVSLCGTGEDGYTSLRDLVQACRTLELDPTPVACSADKLLALGGPAIIAVGRSDASDKSVKRLHFIGLIGRQGDDFLVIDPALRAEPIAVSRDKIARSFTGHAVLLTGCPRPLILPSAVRVVVPCAALVAGLAGLVLFRARRKASKRSLATTEIEP